MESEFEVVWVFNMRENICSFHQEASRSILVFKNWMVRNVRKVVAIDCCLASIFGLFMIQQWFSISCFLQLYFIWFQSIFCDWYFKLMLKWIFWWKFWVDILVNIEVNIFTGNFEWIFFICVEGKSNSRGLERRVLDLIFSDKKIET